MEEIIIDSIDVSKCNHYYKGRCLVSENVNYSIGCNSSKDCYYKQLKRKEKEVQILRSALQEIKEIVTTRNYLNLDEALDDILQKISEVLK